MIHAFHITVENTSNQEKKMQESSHSDPQANAGTLPNITTLSELDAVQALTISDLGYANEHMHVSYFVLAEEENNIPLFLLHEYTDGKCYITNNSTSEILLKATNSSTFGTTSKVEKNESDAISILGYVDFPWITGANQLQLGFVELEKRGESAYYKIINKDKVLVATVNSDHSRKHILITFVRKPAINCDFKALVIVLVMKIYKRLRSEFATPKLIHCDGTLDSLVQAVFNLDIRERQQHASINITTGTKLSDAERQASAATKEVVAAPQKSATSANVDSKVPPSLPQGPPQVGISHQTPSTGEGFKSIDDLDQVSDFTLGYLAKNPQISATGASVDTNVPPMLQQEPPQVGAFQRGYQTSPEVSQEGFKSIDDLDQVSDFTLGYLASVPGFKECFILRRFGGFEPLCIFHLEIGGDMTVTDLSSTDTVFWANNMYVPFVDSVVSSPKDDSILGYVKDVEIQDENSKALFDLSLTHFPAKCCYKNLVNSNSTADSISITDHKCIRIQTRNMEKHSKVLVIIHVMKVFDILSVEYAPPPVHDCSGEKDVLYALATTAYIVPPSWKSSFTGYAQYQPEIESKETLCIKSQNKLTKNDPMPSRQPQAQPNNWLLTPPYISFQTQP